MLYEARRSSESDFTPRLRVYHQKHRKIRLRPPPDATEALGTVILGIWRGNSILVQKQKRPLSEPLELTMNKVLKRITRYNHRISHYRNLVNNSITNCYGRF